ncbi:hypothetical protein C0995_001645, partial [Termitomyces sp. Mi166
HLASTQDTTSAPPTPPEMNPAPHFNIFAVPHISQLDVIGCNEHVNLNVQTWGLWVQSLKDSSCTIRKLVLEYAMHNVELGLAEEGVLEEGFAAMRQKDEVEGNK